MKQEQRKRIALSILLFGFIVCIGIFLAARNYRPLDEPYVSRSIYPEGTVTPAGYLAGLVGVRSMASGETVTPFPGQSGVHIPQTWSEIQADLTATPDWSTMQTRVARLEAQEGGTARTGLTGGPCLEFRRIADTHGDGTPFLDPGGEPQVRYGLFVRQQNGVVGLSLLSGTQDQPNHAALLLTAAPPASASDTGSVGEIRVDAGAVYVCVAPDTWKKVGLSTW